MPKNLAGAQFRSNGRRIHIAGRQAPKAFAANGVYAPRHERPSACDLLWQAKGRRSPEQAPLSPWLSATIL
jgi:hypothetical protein